MMSLNKMSRIFMPMAHYNYVIKPRASQKIRSFYRNVAKKYRHTYDYEDLIRNIHEAVSTWQIRISGSLPT